MLLKNYIAKLQDIQKEYGGDILVVYSSDSEGNNFNVVGFSPTEGKFEDGQFTNNEDDVNCVCIN